jgi:hypothetical protein
MRTSGADDGLARLADEAAAAADALCGNTNQPVCTECGELAELLRAAESLLRALLLCKDRGREQQQRLAGSGASKHSTVHSIIFDRRCSTRQTPSYSVVQSRCSPFAAFRHRQGAPCGSVCRSVLYASDRWSSRRSACHRRSECSVRPAAGSHSACLCGAAGRVSAWPRSYQCGSIRSVTHQQPRSSSRSRSCRNSCNDRDTGCCACSRSGRSHSTSHCRCSSMYRFWRSQAGAQRAACKTCRAISTHPCSWRCCWLAGRQLLRQWQQRQR